MPSLTACLDVGPGRTPTEPDTPEQAALRARIAAEVADLRANGTAIDVRSELPDLTASDESR